MCEVNENRNKETNGYTQSQRESESFCKSNKAKEKAKENDGAYLVQTGLVTTVE